MRLILRTKVVGNYKAVMNAFDEELFLKLSPKFLKFNLEKFTGSKTGDQVHVKFLSPIKSEWISDIVDHGESGESIYFTDRGSLLPFPLKFWEHRHIVERINDESSLIIDDVTYKGQNIFYSLLMYAGVYLSFFARKPIYKKHFENR